MQVFTAVEAQQLFDAMEVLNNPQRVYTLRELIKQQPKIGSYQEIDLEDLGRVLEALKHAGDSIFSALVAAGVYTKDARVNEMIDARLHEDNDE